MSIKNQMGSDFYLGEFKEEEFLYEGVKNKREFSCAWKKRKERVLLKISSVKISCVGSRNKRRESLYFSFLSSSSSTPSSLKSLRD